MSDEMVGLARRNADRAATCDGRVSARDVPYPPVGYNVRVPDAIWDDALATVRCYAARDGAGRQRGSEALVYLAGVVAGDGMIVTGLYRLDHAPQGDRVKVTPGESRWLLRTLSARDEKLIGQLHSHRGLAGHSHGDDIWATSFQRGLPLDCRSLLRSRRDDAYGVRRPRAPRRPLRRAHRNRGRMADPALCPSRRAPRIAPGGR